MKATHRHPPRLTDHAARLSRCVPYRPEHPAYSPGASIALWGTRGSMGIGGTGRLGSRGGVGGNGINGVRLDRSFYCSGKRRVARQAKDHPEGLPTAWHTTWRSPFREKSGPGGQAHLHTTLNKSRDEKLDLARPGSGNASGKRALVMGTGARLPALARAAQQRQKGASTWARTRDLSVNSRALCQLSHGGNTMDTQGQNVHPAGFEPAPSDEDYDLNVAC